MERSGHPLRQTGCISFSSGRCSLCCVKEKMEDYRRIGVKKFWLVSPDAETVEVLRLSENGIERIG